MIVGLTGGIGSGKSTVGKILEGLGVPVYNSDVEAKKLMQSSETIRKKLISLFGERAFDGNVLNRSFIAKKVFNDKQLLQELNRIVHPEVRKHFLEWYSEQNTPYVVQETALLFENKAQNLYDKIILVTAPKELKIQRLLERDGSTEEDILARMENQLKDSEKFELADFVIENIFLEETRKKVEEVNRVLLKLCQNQ
ncbi:dephospho-CoA kinase [Maribacter thermophilus]|uniref:dephospho-CoA kinase n=1 Tax=Maribacter thermophilus TaxID=1197874 RepID=UPI000ACB3D52|nr:dephospho-CoA kinase [Maribacter thermophilus]